MPNRKTPYDYCNPNAHHEGIYPPKINHEIMKEEIQQGIDATPDARDLVAKVLDHGWVRLVDWMGGDISIVRAARVSYDAAWRAGEDEKSDARLIRYLWKNKHTTPFEAVTFTFEVYAPIFVFRQWHRHRTQSYNELSARYKELPTTYYLPNPEKVGSQSKSNKQGRELDGSAREAGVEAIGKHCEAAFKLYKELIDQDWPRELARMVLPLNVYSHMFATMNLLNLFRFLTLRTDKHAQYEICQYADAMVELIKPIVPVAADVWNSFDWGKEDLTR